LIQQLKALEVNESKSANQDIGTAFHLGLAELAGNSFIGAGVADALRRLARVRWLDTAAGSPGWEEHLEILSAIRSGAADVAVRLVQEHLAGSRDRLMKVLEGSRLSIRARHMLTR
jgi:DNA-binding GntR family transcriptional regulator